MLRNKNHDQSYRIALARSFSSHDSDWSNNSEDDGKVEQHDHLSSRKRKYPHEVGNDNIDASSAAQYTYPSIPGHDRDLFDFELEATSFLVDKSDRKQCHKKCGAPCDAAFVNASTFGRSCFLDDDGMVSTNKAGKKVKAEVVKYLMDEIEKSIPFALDETIRSIDKEDDDNTEAKKVVKVNYRSHVDTIKQRVREKLAKIKVPHFYTRGEDNIRKLHPCNKYHMKNIKECEILSENLESEIRKQECLFESLMKKRKELYTQVDMYQNNCHMFRKEFRPRAKDNIMFMQKVKVTDTLSKSPTIKVSSNEEDLLVRKKTYLNQANNIGVKHKQNEEKCCSLKEFLDAIVSPYDDL